MTDYVLLTDKYDNDNISSSSSGRSSNMTRSQCILKHVQLYFENTKCYLIKLQTPNTNKLFI